MERDISVRTDRNERTSERRPPLKVVQNIPVGRNQNGPFRLISNLISGIFGLNGKRAPVKFYHTWRVLLRGAHIQGSPCQWWIQGKAPGGPWPPLFLDQTEARRAEKIFFFSDRVPPYLRVWMTAPLIWRSDDVWYSKPQLLLLNCGTSFSFHCCKQAFSSLILRLTIATASS